MENTKTYYTEDNTYTFDILSEYEVKVPVWYAECRENGKTAWLDRHGYQFEGEGRIAASTTPVKQVDKTYITYEYTPMYPDDCTPITLFHNTLAEAEAYAERIMQESYGDIAVEIYEAKRRN